MPVPLCLCCSLTLLFCICQCVFSIHAFLQALHQQATTLPHQHVSPFPPHPLCVPNGLTPSSHYAAAFPQHAAAGATPQSGLHVHIPSQQHLLANGLGYSSQQATTPQQQTPGGIDANAGLEGLGLLHNLAVTPPVHISPTLDVSVAVCVCLMCV